MLDIMFAYLCECGQCSPVREIPYSDELHQDFTQYVDQRDSYCLISPTCFRKLQISENKIAVKGENYMIIES
jgi:hypothetical protein